ncbi:uncharacterized protein GBIM_07001 [Gryllus bimaculatus]|nr:uncharacterized protein GBIM_07001 [Gryllus bimaculatus]
MQHASRSLEKVSRAMEVALKSMNLEELCKVLDKFEQECLDLDVQTMTMDTSMMQASSFAPQDQIDRFMHQLADEAGLDINLEMPSTRASIPVQDSQEKDLDRRFGALRNK